MQNMIFFPEKPINRKVRIERITGFKHSSIINHHSSILNIFTAGMNTC